MYFPLPSSGYTELGLKYENTLSGEDHIAWQKRRGQLEESTKSPISRFVFPLENYQQEFIHLSENPLQQYPKENTIVQLNENLQQQKYKKCH